MWHYRPAPLKEALRSRLGAGLVRPARPAGDVVRRLGEKLGHLLADLMFRITEAAAAKSARSLVKTVSCHCLDLGVISALA